MPDSDSFRGIREQMLRDLEAPAYQARLKRLQELQEQIDRMMTDVYQQDRKRQTEHYIQTGTDAYYRGIYDVQREAGFQFSFSHVDQKAFDRLLKSKWSGENYSDRIWENTQNVAAAVKDELLMEMLTGKPLDDCAEAIQRRFQVGAFQSRRIMRTESNFVSGQMQQQAYKECGSDYYEYVATLDSRTDEECGALDGKRFRLEDAQPGVNMHPMHPFCRCTTIIALDDEAKADLKRRARDPKSGEESLIPAATTYEQWAKDNGLEVKQRKVVEPGKKKGSTARQPSSIFKAFQISGSSMDGYTPKQQMEMCQLLSNAPTELQDVYQKFGNQLKPPEPPDPSIGSAYYDPFDGRVHLDRSRVVRGGNGKMPYETHFHEYAHNIDSLAGNGTKGYSALYRNQAGESFEDVIMKDWKQSMLSFFKDSAGDAGGVYQSALDLQLQYGGQGGEPFVGGLIRAWRRNQGIDRSDPLYRDLMDELISLNGDNDKIRKFYTDHFAIFGEQVYDEKKTLEAFIDHANRSFSETARRNLSDILEMFSSQTVGKDYPLKFGHGKGYWSTPGALAEETFAHMSESVLANPGSLKLIKKYLPNAYSEYQNILKEMVK